jgi:uncharacterized iron-regulated membrane protein
MRELLLKVHRWMGLVAGIIIFVIAVTGCVLIFENDIDRAANASVLKVTPGPQRVPLQQALQNVRAAYPSETPSAISFPQQPNHALQVGLKGVSVGVDPYTGRVLGKVDRSKGFARWVHLLHTRLLAGRPGEIIVGGFTVVTLLMAITGVYLWWPRQIWTVKATARSWRRLNFDLHNVLGWYSAVLLVFISLSGVLIAYESQLDPLVLKLNGRAVAAKPAQVSSTVIPGAAPISLDEAYRAAQAAVPDAFIANMNIPDPGKAVYRMAVKFPEDRTPAGRSRVAVDQYSGAVLDVVSTRTQPLGTKILNLKRSIHTGDVFGWPSQALAFLVSLALAGQVVTGFLIWWKPGKFGAFASNKNEGVTPSGTRASAAV